jgi:hypothetical protein
MLHRPDAARANSRQAPKLDLAASDARMAHGLPGRRDTLICRDIAASDAAAASDRHSSEGKRPADALALARRDVTSVSRRCSGYGSGRGSSRDDGNRYRCSSRRRLRTAFISASDQGAIVCAFAPSGTGPSISTISRISRGKNTAAEWHAWRSPCWNSRPLDNAFVVAAPPRPGRMTRWRLTGALHRRRSRPPVCGRMSRRVRAQPRRPHCCVGLHWRVDDASVDLLYLLI